jgi:hypothetical protein
MIHSFVAFSCILLVFFLAGCQKKVYLMPTPAIMQIGITVEEILLIGLNEIGKI